MSIFILCTSCFTVMAKEEKEVYFEDATTFYTEFKNVVGIPLRNYFTISDGVIYNYTDVPDDDGYSSAKVIGILPTDENKSIIILDSFTRYGEEVLVTEINIQQSINRNVVKIEMGENIEKIKGFNASGIEFEIGKGVTSIEDSFYNSKDLVLSVHPENPYFKVDDGALYKTVTNEKQLIAVFESQENFEVKADITSFIAPFGKKDTPENRKVKSITINGNLDEFELGVLKNVNTINIADNVTQIQYIDISGAKKLSEVDFSKVTAKSIYANTIKYLKKISLPMNCVIESKAFGSCKNLKEVIVNDTEKAPKIKSKAFKNTSKGIKFYTKSKKIAKQLKKNLKNSGVKNAKIYVGKKVVYKNVK